MNKPKPTKPNERQIMKAIDAIFEKYDLDGNGTLEAHEVVFMLQESFKVQGRK